MGASANQRLEIGPDLELIARGVLDSPQVNVVVGNDNPDQSHKQEQFPRLFVENVLLGIAKQAAGIDDAMEGRRPGQQGKHAGRVETKNVMA